MLGSKTSSRSSGQTGGMSIIAADVVITGNVRATGDVHIDGSVEGDVMCQTLSLGGSGRIHGHITADHAKLGGRIEGSVSARDCEIEAGAHISGDLRYATISIATGAQVEGRMEHRTEGDEAPVLHLIAQDAS